MPADTGTGLAGHRHPILTVGRPESIAMTDGPGALLVADDVGNTVWRVSPR